LPRKWRVCVPLSLWLGVDECFFVLFSNMFPMFCFQFMHLCSCNLCDYLILSSLLHRFLFSRGSLKGCNKIVGLLTPRQLTLGFSFSAPLFFLVCLCPYYFILFLPPKSWQLFDISLTRSPCTIA